MNAVKKQHEWAKLLESFSEQNAGRPTRIGVFETIGNTVNDYWLEDGLPLVGIDIDTGGELPSIQIIVGSFTHEIKEALNIVFRVGINGDEDGMDVTNAAGQTTILRFESSTEST